MTVLTYLQPFATIDRTFAGTDFAPGATALQFAFEDGSGTTRGTITFSVGAGNLIRSGVVEDAAGANLITLTGLALTRAELAALARSIGAGSDIYTVTVSLLDDDTTVTGSSGRDLLECGGGNDRVSGVAGNDTLFKWTPGDLFFNGGIGTDTLSFQTQEGPVYPTPHATGAVVDLNAGTGVNPYGGALRLLGVENVVGTDLADTITGNSASNIIGDGLFDDGADSVDAKGGNDIVHLGANGSGASLDGGAGIDTLRFTTDAAAIGDGQGGFTAGRCVLDLLAPGAGTERFAGTGIEGFEVFQAFNPFAVQSVFVFRGSDFAETVIGADLVPGSFLPSGRDQLFGRGGSDTLNGRSANDLLFGGLGNDSLIGGAGADRLNGGLGADTLSGGTGVDDFVYLDAAEFTGAPTGRDLITDFVADSDRIDLSAIDARTGGADNPFTFIAGVLTGAGQVRAFVQGNNTVIQASTDADAAAELVIVLSGVHALDRGDFIL